MSTRVSCPDTRTLQHLLLGRLSPEEVDRLEEHLAECSPCGEALRTLGAEDELVSALRAAGGTEAAAQAAVEAVIPWLKRLRPADATRTLGPESQPTPCPGVTATFDFLSPPEAGGELGRLGRYRILRMLGAGGMGVVFLAEDTNLQRHVAMKVIKPELLERSETRERFVREAQSIAAVEHDNIVTIHEVAEHDGVPYLTMPLLRGQSLHERLQDADGALPLDETLRLGRDIAAGLAAAHARGLVHRDIKPANIWLETRDEASGGRQPPVDPVPQTKASGGRQPPVEACEASVTKVPPLPLASRPSSLAPRVKILDFGLAQAVRGEESGERTPGAVIGTPAYMAPEQARGLASDARSDLFSLGCVMYRMATGRPAFQGKDTIALLMQIATEEPIAPRQLNPHVPPALDVLIRKLLAKQPQDRPASAQAVVEALHALEQERAEAARPRLSRRRWLLGMAAAVALAVGLTIMLLSRKDDTQEPPPPAPGEVTFTLDEPEQLLVLQRGDEPEQVIDLKEGGKHRLPPGDYTIRPKVEVPRRRLWPGTFHLKAGEALVLQLRLVGEIRNHKFHSPLTVWSLAVSPRAGSLLSVSGDGGGYIVIWDAAADDPRILGGPLDGPVYSLALSPDGKRVASGWGGRGVGKRSPPTIDIWDAGARLPLASILGPRDAVTALAWDRAGKRLLSGDSAGSASIWDVAAAKEVHVLKGHERLRIHAVAFSPDGKQALTAGADARVILWDVEQGKELRRLEGHEKAVTGVAFLGGGQAVSAGEDGTLRIWDLKDGTVRVQRKADAGVTCLACAADGQRLLTGHKNGAVCLWNAAMGERIHCFQGPERTVHGVAFSADGRRAVSAGADSFVRLWELPR